MGWIKAMGYLGVQAPDLDAWREFGIGVLGMEEGSPPSTTADSETLYLRMDDHAYRIACIPHHEPGVAYVGWEVADADTLSRLAAHLRENGVKVTEGTAEEAASRRVAGLLKASDPGGTALEFFHGPEKGVAFKSPRNLRFVTGDGGMGHSFMVVPDAAEAQHFYEDILGFKLSDTITMPFGGDGRFYHTNPRHHSLAFASIPGMPVTMFQHLMVEVDSPQHVIDAYDTLVAQKAKITSGLGKHTNDLMFSFYVPTPSGFDIEYGSNGRRIENDDTWEVGSYDAASLWGHVRTEMPALPPEVLAAMGVETPA